MATQTISVLVTFMMCLSSATALSCASTLECPSRTSSDYQVSSNIFDMETVETDTFGYYRYSVSTSVSFDAEREEFVYSNLYYNDDGMKYDTNQINANYADEEVTDPGYETTNLLDSTTVLPIGHNPYYLGSEIAGDTLYAVDYYGRLIAVDLETHNVVNYIDLPAFPSGTATSVCLDSTDMIAYVVDGIAGAFYSVDVANDTLGAWDLDTINAPFNEITDINGANSQLFVPMDCTVLDGKVFSVDVSSPSFGVYDIDAGTYIYDADVLSVSANSIASSNGILVIGGTNDDSTEIQFYTYDCCDSTQTEFVQVANITQESLSLGQIDINWMDGVIVAATVVDNARGYLRFVQSDDLIYTPPIATTTEEPEADTTISPTESDEVTVTESTVVVAVTTPEGRSSTASPKFLCKTTLFVSLFVVIFHFV